MTNAFLCILTITISTNFHISPFWTTKPTTNKWSEMHRETNGYTVIKTFDIGTLSNPSEFLFSISTHTNITTRVE